DSGPPSSSPSVSSATLTIVVSRTDMMAPRTTTIATRRMERSSGAVAVVMQQQDVTHRTFRCQTNTSGYVDVIRGKQRDPGATGPRRRAATVGRRASGAGDGVEPCDDLRRVLRVVPEVEDRVEVEAQLL